MNILNAICFIPGRKTRKYRIRNTTISIQRFESFCEKINVETINYYDKNSRKHLYQVRLNKNPHPLKTGIKEK